jgi:5'-phosphate synthase pdxT subunit
LLPIGVLALQGDVREHIQILDQLNIANTKVRKAADLDGISGLIIPGGESTVLDKLSKIFAIREPLITKISQGLPVFGTCAGLIMLANKLQDGTATQQTFGGLDVTVRRNAFGSQLDSFETTLNFKGIGQVEAAFIRAPIITSVGENVEILAELSSGEIVAVKQGNLLGISFHPEIVAETRVHEYFAGLCKNAEFMATN